MSRHVIAVMGTVFSLDIRADILDPAVLDAVTHDLRWVDEVFSTYRPDSQISRLATGVLRVEDCAPEVGQVLELCAEYSRRTNGYFTATPGGRLDPSGLVKGWAIARASALLTAKGLRRHAVNGGGDVQTVGEPEPGRCWRIGVTHPFQPGRLATVVSGTGIAVATSGTAERGSHIVNPFTGQPATEIASATVVGADIVSADVFATAAVAMGTAARGWLQTLPDYAGYLMHADGEQWATESFRRYLPAGDEPPATDDGVVAATPP